MTCKEAELLVIPYIRGELDDETLQEFLDHVDSCPECREELEIYFTVDVGIRQLDSETGTYNIKGALEAALEESRDHLQTLRFMKIIRYSVTTLCVMALFVTLLLQIRIWWQWGLL